MSGYRLAAGCATDSRAGLVLCPCHAALPAVVFDMHYNELLLKNEEIERLKTVIEGLGSGS